MLEINWKNIPVELKTKSRWVLWEYQKREDKLTKVPVNEFGFPISIKDSGCLKSFEEIEQLFFNSDKKFSGIGFVFNSDGIIGIDIDDAFDESGDIKDSAFNIVKELRSYTEYSPSGAGIHIIGYYDGNLDALKKPFKNIKVEIYSKDRFFTITGDLLLEEYNKLTNISKPVIQIKKEITVFDKLKQRLNSDEEFRNLYLNKHSSDKDRSQEDFRLVKKLSEIFSSVEEIDAAFRTSGKYRPKWDEKRGNSTYGKITIQKVLFNNQYPKQVNLSGRLNIESLWDDVMKFRNEGLSRGFNPGWDELDTFYRPTLGAMTVLLGVPSSGKSTFMDNIAVNMALKHGWKFSFVSFETWPVERHIHRLIQIYLNKPTFTFLPGHASIEEMNSAREALKDFFFFIVPEDNATVNNILLHLLADIDEHGVEGFVLDPFTECDLDFKTKGVQETRAIEMDLRAIQHFTRLHKIHSWVLVHPTKSSEHQKIEKRGARPTLYSASGSAHFRNKADFGLVIHRWDDNKVSLYIDKVRNDSNGAIGEVLFQFDNKTKNYLPIADIPEELI